MRIKRDTEQLGEELAGQWDQSPRQRILDDPRTKHLQINKERCEYWLSVGAQPTDRVERLFGLAGIDLPPKMAIERGRKRAQGRAAYWCQVFLWFCHCDRIFCNVSLLSSYTNITNNNLVHDRGY